MSKSGQRRSKKPVVCATGKILDSFQSLAFYHLVMEKPINEYELESDIRFLYTPPVCIVALKRETFCGRTVLDVQHRIIVD